MTNKKQKKLIRTKKNYKTLLPIIDGQTLPIVTEIVRIHTIII